MTGKTITRRQALEKAAAAGAGLGMAGSLAAPAIERAAASVASPVVKHAFATLKPNGDGFEDSGMVAMVRLDAPGRVRLLCDAFDLAGGSVGSRIMSLWVDTVAVAPGIHIAMVDFPEGGVSTQVPVAVGHIHNGLSWEWRVQITNPAGGNQHIDPGVWRLALRPASAPSGNGTDPTFELAFGVCVTNPYPTLAQWNAGTRPPSEVPVNIYNPGALNGADAAWNNAAWPHSYVGTGLKAWPSAYFHFGDFGYPDASINVEQQLSKSAAKIGYLEANLYQQTNAKFQTIAKNLPIFFMGDDHDYGQDGAYRGGGTPVIPAGAFPGKGPYKQFAAQAMEAAWPLHPAGTLAAPGVPYRMIKFGRQCDVFLLDNRRFADPQGADAGGTTYFSNGLWYSLLGDVQRQWLKDQLVASLLPLKIIVSPMALHYSYSLGERNDLLNFIADNVDGRVLIVSGDLHNQAHVRWRPTGHVLNTPIDEVMVAPGYNNFAPITAGHATRDTQYAAGLGFSRLYPATLPTTSTAHDECLLGVSVRADVLGFDVRFLNPVAKTIRYSAAIA